MAKVAPHPSSSSSSSSSPSSSSCVYSFPGWKTFSWTPSVSATFLPLCKCKGNSCRCSRCVDTQLARKTRTTRSRGVCGGDRSRQQRLFCRSFALQQTSVTSNLGSDPDSSSSSSSRTVALSSPPLPDYVQQFGALQEQQQQEARESGPTVALGLGLGLGIVGLDYSASASSATEDAVAAAAASYSVVQDAWTALESQETGPTAALGLGLGFGFVGLAASASAAATEEAVAAGAASYSVVQDAWTPLEARETGRTVALGLGLGFVGLAYSASAAAATEEAVAAGAASYNVVQDAWTALVAAEPKNALSLPTWIIHVASVAEWLTAMALVWRYGNIPGKEAWKGLSWGMVPLLGGAMCACTWHFFYNAPSLEVLVLLQAALTTVGNCTMWIAAFRIFQASRLQQSQQVGSSPEGED